MSDYDNLHYDNMNNETSSQVNDSIEVFDDKNHRETIAVFIIYSLVFSSFLSAFFYTALGTLNWSIQPMFSGMLLLTVTAVAIIIMMKGASYITLGIIFLYILVQTFTFISILLVPEGFGFYKGFFLLLITGLFSFKKLLIDFSKYYLVA